MDCPTELYLTHFFSRSWKVPSEELANESRSTHCCSFSPWVISYLMYVSLFFHLNRSSIQASFILTVLFPRVTHHSCRPSRITCREHLVVILQYRSPLSTSYVFSKRKWSASASHLRLSRYYATWWSATAILTRLNTLTGADHLLTEPQRMMRQWCVEIGYLPYLWELCYGMERQAWEACKNGSSRIRGISSPKHPENFCILPK